MWRISVSISFFSSFSSILNPLNSNLSVFFLHLQRLRTTCCWTVVETNCIEIMLHKIRTKIMCINDNMRRTCFDLIAFERWLSLPRCRAYEMENEKFCLAYCDAEGDEHGTEHAEFAYWRTALQWEQMAIMNVGICHSVASQPMCDVWQKYVQL